MSVAHAYVVVHASHSSTPTSYSSSHTLPELPNMGSRSPLMGLYIRSPRYGTLLLKSSPLRAETAVHTLLPDTHIHTFFQIIKESNFLFSSVSSLNQCLRISTHISTSDTQHMHHNTLHLIPSHRLTSYHSSSAHISSLPSRKSSFRSKQFNRVIRTLGSPFPSRAQPSGPDPFFLFI